MPYTLADYARLEKDPLRAGVIDVFRRESWIMEYLSFESIDTLGITVLRTKSLPNVSFRKINAGFAEGKGQIEPMSERVYDAGAYIDVDKLLVKAKSLVDARAMQADMIVTSLSYLFNDYFINGDPTIDEDGLTGLWYRSLNTKFTVTGSHYNPEAGLDISPDSGALSASEDKALDYIQGAMHRLDGHKADIIGANDTFYLRLISAIRKKGLFATTEDSYGRQVSTYGPGGPKIIDLGTKADQTSRIIGDVENVNGLVLSGGTASSIYFFRLGEKYLRGIQLYPVDVDDVGKLEDARTFRTAVDWPMGIAHPSPRAIVRLSGIVVA